jgi:sterol desaturase/sphingolipid hydroxylase (fatty acid hydroxylase superfamily)
MAIDGPGASVRAVAGLVCGVLLIFAGTALVSVFRDDVLSGRGFDLARYCALAPWIAMFFAPLGVLCLTAVYMAVECRAMGYERSSFRRLLNWQSDDSVQDDVFYFVLSLSSLSFLAMMLLTLGVGYWINWLAVRDYGLTLAESVPRIPQFFILLFVFTFLNYWQHRLNHYRAFWHIHKVHHSATSLTLLTPQRNHPVNAVFVNLTETLPIAILGFDPSVYVTLRIINSLYQISVHSHLDWGGDWVRRYLLITPAMHWVHHSNKARHWNTNFGIISLWDALFGTLYVPTAVELASIQFGVGRDTVYNTPGRTRNMTRIYLRFVKHLLRDLGRWGNQWFVTRRTHNALATRQETSVGNSHNPRTVAS